MQLENRARGGRPSSTDLLRLAWQVGNRSQRIFALLAAAAPSASAVLMFAALVFLYARGGIEEDYTLFFLGFIAIAAWTAFQRPIVASMRGPEFWRARINRNWVPRGTEDFYEELARYKAEHGARGQLSGDAAWSAAFLAVYWATMVVAIILVWSLPLWSSVDLLIVFSLVEFPLGFGCMLLYGRRNRRQFDLAVSLGYQFATFRLGRLHRLQP